MIARQRSWEEKPMQFEETADLYTKYCSDYPIELINSLISKTGLKAKDSILEIGSGSGKATRLLVDYGFQITCVEPGQQLVSFAMQSLQNKPDLKFIVSPFEDWVHTNESFDVVFSAQAFHWLKKETKYQKCAKALKDKKYLALCWNMYLNDDTTLISSLAEVCRNYGVLNFITAEAVKKEIAYNVDEIEKSKLFSSPWVHTFSRTERNTAEDLINFLSTGEGYQDLVSEARDKLNRDIIAIFDQNSGIINRPIISALYVARKL